MTATTTTGSCVDCGTAVERPVARGLGAKVFNELPFRCETCEQVMLEENEREERERERRELLDKATRRIEHELPPALRAVHLDQLDPVGCAEAITAARTWAVKGGGLLLTGDFGVGKTTIAAGAFRERLLFGHRGRWTSAPLIMARLGSGFGSPQREQAVDVLTGGGTLVLDDLDKTRPTEYGAEQIFLAIDGAVTNCRPLLVTTNLGPDALAARWPDPYGEAIASRLVGYCTVIRVNGDDRRLKGAAR